MTAFADLAGALDSLLSARVWSAQSVPDDAEFPYAGISFEAFPTLPTMTGDGRTTAWSRLAQVDLWQQIDAESDDLRRQVIQAIDGLALGEHRLRAYVVSVVRAPEDRPSSAVHDAITVRIAELG